MMRGMYSGVSGLINHQTRMDVIGNNISNINTVGFKSSDVVFQDFLSQLVEIAHAPQGNKGGTGPMQIGMGSQIGSMDKDFTQGSLIRTNNALDVAVEGNGFFVVNDGTADYFTRAGHFSLDSEGSVVMAPGLKLQGWAASPDPITGEITISSSTEPIGDLQIKTGDVIPAKATSTVTFAGNLNSEMETALKPITVEWSAGNAISPTISKIDIEFEHAHPSLPYYIWSAKWSENPPAGFSVGDSVIDANTGYDATGIIELNDADQIRAQYLYELGRLDEAFIALSHYQITTDRPELLGLRARILWGMGRLPDAKRDFNSVLGAEENSPIEIVASLVRLNDELGDWE